MENIFTRIAWRLIPFMGLLYVTNFLDRVNVGFAALTMNRDLGLGAEAFGVGAGIFFLGYFFFEVPSNVILERVGARLWIFRIMLSWGLVSMAMAFAQGPWSFYALRFLLGVTEADVMEEINSGKLPAKKIGSSYRVTRASLDAFLAQ